jgi:hypothetical protein
VTPDAAGASDGGVDTGESPSGCDGNEPVSQRCPTSDIEVGGDLVAARVGQAEAVDPILLP